MTYNPFQVFFSKKFSRLDENSNEEAAKEWNSLSDLKRLKYVKKAESNYDQSVEENKQPFHTYLSDKELELLIKSYDFPEKPSPNIRYFYINKYKRSIHDDEQDEDEESKQEKASENWKKLTLKEKKEIIKEFYEIWKAYESAYCDFVRNLPDERIVDYKFYLTLKKNSQSSAKKSLNSKTVIQQTQSTLNAAKKKKRSFRLFEPFEKFAQEIRIDNKEDIIRISRKERAFLRNQFNALSDEQMLKYIKQAEKEYDSFDFERNKERPLFTSFLNKKEIKILFNSYELPESVPYNLASYFMKKMYKSGTRDIKVVFKRFREQSTKEREEISQEHTQELENYLAKTRLFIDHLPKERQPDYEFFKNGKNKLSDSKHNAKRIRTN